MKTSIFFAITVFARDILFRQLGLTHVDSHILTVLASHQGNNALWYISHDQLATECLLKRSALINHLNKLECLELIRVTRTGKANGYTVTIPPIPGKPWVTDVHPHAPPPVDNFSDVHPRTPVMSTCVDIRCPPAWTHKRTVSKKKERESVPVDNFPSSSSEKPLSLSFEPNDANKLLAQSLKVDLQTELESFLYRHKGDKNQWEFARWIKLAHQYAQRQTKTFNQQSYAPVNRKPFYENPVVQKRIEDEYYGRINKVESTRYERNQPNGAIGYESRNSGWSIPRPAY